MAKECTLHFFPGSYYSLKAVLALHEKGIPFKESIVHIYNGEQNADWYLKLNPKGQVPVLQHGDKVVPDSEDIIDYIDLHWSSGPNLVPDIETAEGQDAYNLRKMLHEVPVETITFGVLANRNFCTTEMRLPYVMKSKMTKDGIRKRKRGNLDSLRKKWDKATGEAKAALNAKIEGITKLLDTIFNEESVAKVLDDLEGVFDKMEDQLEKSRKAAGNEETYWLLGSTITAADIIATTLMLRLYMLGIDNRYFSDTKRLLVKHYHDRLYARPAVKKTIATMETMGAVMAKAAAWKIAKAGLAVGVVIIGVLAAREILSSRRGLSRI